MLNIRKLWEKIKLTPATSELLLGFLIITVALGSCGGFCYAITVSENPPKGAKIEEITWTEPVSGPFQSNNQTCQAFIVVKGISVNGERWARRREVVGRFVQCGDQKLQMESLGNKGGTWQ